MLKAAVIGVGNMGRHHARNYSENSGVKLVGISDINSKTGKEIAKTYNTKFYPDYLDLIDKEKPDAVSIVVPTHLHKEIALNLINLGINILIEKPIAANIADAKILINAAKNENIVLTVGHIERFNPAVIKLKELVKENKLGDILSIVVRRVGLFPPQITDVNVVTDIAVHDLDIITDIIGKLPRSILATGSGALTNGREDHSEIFMDYGKFGCFIQTNWITPIKIRTLSITGTKGHAELNFLTQKLSLYKSNYSLTEYKGFREFKEFLVKFGEPEKVRINIRKKEPLKLELENFINSVRNKTQPKVTAEDALRALLLAKAANNSIKSHKVVQI